MEGPYAARMDASSRSTSRFWLVVLIFAALNAATWVAYHRIYGVRRADILRVESFSPGDGATISTDSELQWKFNLDVRPSKDALAPGTITPAIAGKWRWNDARTLCFAPEKP